MATLASLRYDRGLSQTELAKQANIPQSTISRIEAGNSYVISPAAMKRVADVLGVRVSEVDEFAAKIQGKDLPVVTESLTGRQNKTAAMSQIAAIST